MYGRMMIRPFNFNHENIVCLSGKHLPQSDGGVHYEEDGGGCRPVGTV